MKRLVYTLLGSILLASAIITVEGKTPGWVKKLLLVCVEADYTVNVDCITRGAQFTNKTIVGIEGASTEDVTYFWEFGDGSTSEKFSPFHAYGSPGVYNVKLTARYLGSECVSVKIKEIRIPQENNCYPCPEDVKIQHTEACVGQPIVFSFTSDSPIPPYATIVWSFGDGASSIERNPSHIYASAGSYYVSLNIVFNGPGETTCRLFDDMGEVSPALRVIACPPPDQTECCDGSFAPLPGKKYVICAWVKERGGNTFSYTGPAITLSFKSSGSLGPFKPKGEIIDGWQRIDEEFTAPSTAASMKVSLINNGSNPVFFDDIRIHPFNSSMKSFVYDPHTLRLVAEMDENNYATVYEYNEEGELIRVKKETERGMMTVNESRNSQKKQ